MSENVRQPQEIEKFMPRFKAIEVSDKAKLRIPHIIRGIVEGKTLEQIASDLDVDPRTIYRDRQSIQYRQFINDLVDVHLKDLAELSQDPKTKVEAMKERGRHIRAGVEKRIEQRERKEQIIIHIDDFKQPTKKVESNQVSESD